MTPVQQARKTASPFNKPKPKAQDGSFEFQMPSQMGAGRGRIPKGKYIGRCTSIVNDTSKSSGNPMWTWEFVITKGEHAGRDFKLWTVLTDDAAWKVAETLKALGVKAEAGSKVRINKKDVIGVGCTMHIKDDAGQDGDGEFSKLDKISAHPNGAGFRPGSGALASKAKEQEAEDDEDERGYPADMDDDLDEDEDTDEELEDVDDDDDEDADDLEDEDDDVEEDVEEKPAQRSRRTAPSLPKAGRSAGSNGKAKPAIGKTAAKKTSRR